MADLDSILQPSPSNGEAPTIAESSDEEYEKMTAAEVLAKLEEVSVIITETQVRWAWFPEAFKKSVVTAKFKPFQAWINEKFAPDLLNHKTEIVDCILDQIKEMVCWL